MRPEGSPDGGAGQRFLAWLVAAPRCGDVAVAGWRLDLTEAAGFRVGVRDGRLGGPYEGPGVATRLGGSLDLHWSDGTLTRAAVDRPALADPAGALAEWRAAASWERRLPPLAAPATVPELLVYDPAVASAAGGWTSVLVDLARRLAAGIGSNGARRVDATLRASVGRRLVATSAGFRAAWDETTCRVEAWADEIAGATFELRRLPTDAEVADLIVTTARLADQLGREDALPLEPRGVLLMPPVVEALIARFLLPNLAGRAIRDGRSPLSLADLDAGRPLFRPDLDLWIDTTLPFAPATAPCSPDGIPAGRAALIAGGALVAPVLDVTTADELGRPPTPSPRGRPLALLTSRAPWLTLEEALALLGDGVAVRDLPGLHTQSPRGWSYAVTAPDGQAVRGGRPGGRCSVRVTGSLLDHLQQPSTRLVRISGEQNPGLVVVDGIHLAKA